MQLVAQNSESSHFTFPHVGITAVLPPAREPLAIPKVPANADAIETNLYEMRIDDLRDAIRKNEVSFPSQVPTFPKHDRPDLQRKLVQLYFCFGWSGPKIGARYGLSRLRVQQILNSWKRRAVEVGYVQRVPAETFTLFSERPPIKVILSPVVTGSSAPVVHPSAPRRSGSQLLANDHIPDWVDPQRGPRPRARFDISQIVDVLRQLQAGRTVVEMANEMGVSAQTIRTWREQHEIRLLRRENAELKERLTRLGAVEKTLIDLITRSDNAQPPTFMPFSQNASHTEFEYSESR
jgi:Transposase